MVQRAAEAALSEECQKQCRVAIDYYLENARIIGDVLKKKGIPYTGGENSPSLWLECPNQMKSWEFFDYLLENANVVGTPGSGFGPSGEHFFRLTAFGSYESTVEAIERIRKMPL